MSNPRQCTNSDAFDDKKDPPSLSEVFFALRKSRSSNATLEIFRLETRLEKILSLGKTCHESSQKKHLEQQIVGWQENSSECFVCKHGFSPLQRKHHCRLCGKLICGNTKTCSSFYHNQRNSVRICYNCNCLLAQKNRFCDVTQTSFQNLYKIYSQQKNELDHKLNNYNEALQSLIDEQHSSSFSVNSIELDNSLAYHLSEHHSRQLFKNKLSKVHILKTELLDRFIQLDKLLKSISGFKLDDKTPCKAFTKLSANVCQSGFQYLQQNMSNIKSLPSSTNSAQPSATSSSQKPGSFIENFASVTKSWLNKLTQSSPHPLTSEEHSVFLQQKTSLESSLALAISQGNADAIHPIKNAINDLNAILNSSSCL